MTSLDFDDFDEFNELAETVDDDCTVDDCDLEEEEEEEEECPVIVAHDKKPTMGSKTVSPFSKNLRISQLPTHALRTSAQACLIASLEKPTKVLSLTRKAPLVVATA